MQQISTAPKADAWRLPCPAHAPGYVANSNAVGPPKPAGPPAASPRKRDEVTETPAPQPPVKPRYRRQPGIAAA
jgi:hypothetical protein